MKIPNWIQVNKSEFGVLLTILLTGAFLRLYRISEYMLFLGDEGRDAVIVRRLLVNFDPILIGPGTSIGNMYLGPLYYYLMAPAMLLSGLSPIGPAFQIALFGVATIFLVWFIAREWFGGLAAVVAAALYAVSPVVIIYSRSSWNPNIMPFFALVCIYGIWRVWKKQEWWWLIVVGISYAFVLQSHYLGLLLAPTLGIFWLLTASKVWNEQKTKKYFLLSTLYSLLVFILLMSPLVIFDARHGWNNFNAMKTFFTYRQETVSVRPWTVLPEMWPLFEQMSTRLIAATSQAYGKWLSWLLVFSGIGILWLKRKILVDSPILLLTTWLGFGLLGLALYKQHIYDHYFGFMFAVPFLLLGAVVQQVLSSKYYVAKMICIVGVAGLVLLNLFETPIKYSPQGQLKRTEIVAAKIAQEAGEKPFNLAILAERNYEDGYQYFLEWWKKPIREIEPLRYHETVAENLFVVCELPPEKCDPTHSSKSEITTFGWSKIAGVWDVGGVKVYKLVHNPTGEPQ